MDAARGVRGFECPVSCDLSRWDEKVFSSFTIWPSQRADLDERGSSPDGIESPFVNEPPRHISA